MISAARPYASLNAAGRWSQRQFFRDASNSAHDSSKRPL
jgi:hypothetical protein